VIFHVLTIFPEFFEGPFAHGVVKRAKDAGLLDIRIHNLRDWTHDRHKTVDDRPFGGGEGMVLKPEPLFSAVETIWPERRPDQKVVLLSVYDDEQYLYQALRAGAAGYLLKDADLLELERAVAAVVRGETYLSPAISKHVIADYKRRVSGQPDPIDRLTPRQREVLQLIAEGLSTKEIAFKLSLSAKTVETHRAQLMERLDIRDVAGLVRFAVRTGLIDPAS